MTLGEHFASSDPGDNFMTLDRWIGLIGAVLGLATLVVAWLTFRATLAGVRHARVAALASEAALAAQRAQEAAAELSELEQLILLVALGRPDRTFLAPVGGLPGFRSLVVAFRPDGPPFLPIGNHELEHLLFLGFVEEAAANLWTDPLYPNTFQSPRQLHLTPKGVLRATALSNLDVPTLIERHQVHRGAS